LAAAKAGSPLARAILEEAAGHVAALACAAWRPGLDLAVAGGLAPALAPLLATRLEHSFACRPASPLRGALLVAQGRKPPEFTPEPEPV